MTTSYTGAERELSCGSHGLRVGNPYATPSSTLLIPLGPIHGKGHSQWGPARASGPH